MSVPPPARSGERVIDLDVARAIALIGVCVMNYHAYLVLRGANPGDGFWSRVFDPWTGPLSTRFAATFVVVAGMGVSLMTNRAVLSGDAAARSRVRWVLIRRGVLLFAFGLVLDWVWSGTILFFYGAYFLVAAAIFTLRSRWLALIGTAAALAAAAVQWWALDRRTRGHDTGWLLDGQAESTLSPRDLLLDTVVRGTHPLLPWVLFLCLGMILGRRLPFDVAARVNLVFVGVLLVAAGSLFSRSLPLHPMLASTHPFDRGVFYSLSTVGSSLVAIGIIGWIAERTAGTRVTQALAVTGRTTLTIYVLHVLVFNLVVDWLEWVQPAGLATALLFAIGFWVAAIVLANLWHTRHEFGPLEWVYRRFSA